MEVTELFSTRCAICNTEDNATELYRANFDLEAFTPSIFSARRLPDRIHYRMVRCNTCGLVRSDPVASPQLLAQLYLQSTFDYESEVPNLKLTYGHYLAKLSALAVRKDSLLEIGCANGFFLEEALAQGYVNVRGVDPSAEAVAKASRQVRQRIVCGMMCPGLFQPEQFDVICMFQVLDHVADPAGLIDECLRLLKPSGLLLCVNHNIEAVSAKILREHSPIIDIEHTYLYSLSTIGRIFAMHGFLIRHVGSVYNKYSINYLAHLMPLPVRLKPFLLGWLKIHRIGQIRLSVPLGNLHLIAQKPQ